MDTEQQLEAIVEHIKQVENILYWQEMIIAFYGELGERAITFYIREKQ